MSEGAADGEPACRLCGAALVRSFADLGSSPLANAYVEPGAAGAAERFYPLHAYVCEECLLVQLPEHARPEEIFSDYPYFSSVSESWLDHARAYAERMTGELGLGPGRRVLEVASNDGYLLRHFRDRGVPVLGVEPAANVAAAAREAGIPTVVRFFGREVARELAADPGPADLLVANNVLAHVPDVNDFVAGIGIALAPDGLATLEFPHLQRLIERLEFDTIYHEHYSYFSLLAAERLLGAHDLAVVDVEELPTHGGSLRVHVRHAGTATAGPAVAEVLGGERAAGLDRLDTYAAFESGVRAARRSLLDFLAEARDAGRRVVAYGAAAKGTTLLNYCGIGRDLVEYVVDRSPHKQGRLMPGVHLPIHPPERVAADRPDYLLLLAWNLRDEVMAQMAHVREWGCRFVTPLPRVAVHD